MDDCKWDREGLPRGRRDHLWERSSAVEVGMGIVGEGPTAWGPFDEGQQRRWDDPI